MRGRSLHVSLEASRPLLDLTSYARRGPPEVMRLTAEEIAQITKWLLFVLTLPSCAFISLMRRIDIPRYPS